MDGKVNTDQAQALAGHFGILSIPTLMISGNGILLLSQPGVVPLPSLNELLQQAQALDMAQVRRDIEAQRESSRVTWHLRKNFHDLVNFKLKELCFHWH